MRPPSTHRQRLWPLMLGLVVMGLAACSGRGPDGTRREGSQTPSPTVGSTSPGATAASTAAPSSASITPASTPGGPVNGCTAAALDRCDYGTAAGQVTERIVTITDASTGRKLPVRVLIPEGKGPFPIVLYSHGGGFDDNGYTVGANWSRALAPQGYIVGAIAHVVPTVEQGASWCTAASVPKAECLERDEDSGLVGYAKMRDILGIIDALPTLAGATNGVAESSRLAVIGWSAGARATIATRGTSFYPSPGAPIFSKADPRIGAIATFSPSGVGFGGFFETGSSNSWTTLQAPVLVATGDNDVKPNKPELTGPIRRQAFDRQPPGGTRLLLYSKLPLGVGGHGTFNLGDAGSGDPRLARYSRALASAVRAFLDASLKGTAPARAWLASPNAAILAGEVDWLSK